jgi:aarF domain-containing kinase
MWNKGLFIKLGQHLSSLNQVLPREFISILAVLQDQAPHLGFNSIRKIIEKELGAPLDEMFVEFDEEPVASASLAQVHRARLRTGDEVAVKVQYPQLQRQFNGDMFAHWASLWCASRLFKSFDLEWTHDEVEENLRKELDFRTEADNAERTARNMSASGASFVYVPIVHRAFLTSRVMVMEYVHGIKVTEVDRIVRELNVPPHTLVRDVVSMTAEQIFVHGFVHADPHPGNVFVRRKPGSSKEHQIVLLDHGLYKELSPTVRVNYARLWRALVMQDDAAVKTQSLALGVHNWELFAILVLMRPYRGGGVGMVLRPDSAETRRITHTLLADPEYGFWATMKTMPRELLLVLRSQNYMRYLDVATGSPVNRCLTMARVAVRGANAGETSVNSRWSFHALRERITMEFYLSLFGFYYYASAVALRWMRRWNPELDEEMKVMDREIEKALE